jgi:hypothetical protein
MEEEVMRIVKRGGSGLRCLLTVVATTFLIGACQQPSPAGSGGSRSLQQQTADDQNKVKSRCCHRAGRNNSN